MIRDSTQGRLHARVWAARVWQWDGASVCARSRWLLVRQNADGAFKYSLSNCDAQTTWELPLLSASDRVELLAFYLPRRPRTETEVIRQLQQRHAARQSDIERRKSSPISVFNK